MRRRVPHGSESGPITQYSWTLRFASLCSVYAIVQKHADRKFLMLKLVSKNEISLYLTHTASNERLRTLNSRSV